MVLMDKHGLALIAPRPEGHVRHEAVFDDQRQLLL